jgi:NADPH:quinone reductase-like Zn-dependent oxidoreductase
MKAMRIHKFGGPEVLAADELPTPTPGSDQVWLKVKAASINPVDYKTRQGKGPGIKEHPKGKIVLRTG